MNMKKFFLGKTFLSLGVAGAFALCGGLFPAMAETAITDSVVAIQDVQPEFPASAMRREASGYVVVRFDVMANGKARNVQVIESQPARIFDSSAIRAVRQSEFSITSEESEVRGVERVYRFQHENSLNDQSVSMY